MTDTRANLIAEETAREIPSPVRAFAAALAARAPGKVSAVLFYGSNLRSGDLEGVLDFYVLVDELGAWHRGYAGRLASTLLPPNVEFCEHAVASLSLRAKVAVMTPRRFAAASRFASLDTSIWARFSQPVAIAWMRDAEARENTVAMLSRAVTTAAHWAALLGPERGTPEDYWRALYAATYGNELRVEKTSRSGEIVAHDGARYARLLEPAWQAAGVAFTNTSGVLTPRLTPAERARARRSWNVRRMAGKFLNIARLAKASFTFRGGVDYIVWKTGRHAQVALDLTPWQKRHPILAAPRVLWRLWRQGVLR